MNHIHFILHFIRSPFVFNSTFPIGGKIWPMKENIPVSNE